MGLFRELSEQETKQFRQWARDNYKPLDEIKGIWHPVVQAECVRINIESQGDRIMEQKLKTGDRVYSTGVYLIYNAEKDEYKLDCLDGDMFFDGVIVESNDDLPPYIEISED